MSITKQPKHVIAETLRDAPHTIAIVTKQIQNEVVTRYYLAVEDIYAEILPERPRATKIKRHTLCKRIDSLSTADDITIVTQDSLPADVAKITARKVAPIREELSTDRPRSRSAPSESPPKLDRLDKHARDMDPTVHLDIASSPAGDSNTHGGGW